MIEISGLTFQYPQSVGLALDNINLKVLPGTLTLVAGASGTGKSTLLRCINGLVPHFSGGTISGNINVFGSDPIKEGPEALAPKVGFVFQEPEAQFVFDIVEDEVAFALENAGTPNEEMHNRVDEALAYLHINDIRNKKINEISGGEMQKVAIASALVSHPQVLILDEPTSQLDPVSADEILQYIVSLKSSLGLTVFISEHRLERLLQFTDKIAYLTPQHQFRFGSPQQIVTEMQEVPPVIQIGRKLNLSPLPLTPHDFPPVAHLKQIPSDQVHLTKIPPTHTPLLEIQRLSTKYNHQQVLKNATLHLGNKEILALLGPNGAGKTTLLRSVLGLIPSTGVMRLSGQNIKEMGLAEVIQHIAYLPQNPNDLLFAETVLDELKITLKNHDVEKSESELVGFLTNFGLEGKQHQYPRDLSVGERQRTALAAITIHDPKIIFLDEPTRGLDYFAKNALSQLLQSWRDQGKSILLVTHDIEFAARIADRVSILEDGQICFNGSPNVAFSQLPQYRTQTAQIFPGFQWITPEDITF